MSLKDYWTQGQGRWKMLTHAFDTQCFRTKGRHEGRTMLELTRWKPKGSTYPQLLSPDSLRPTTDAVSNAQHSHHDRGDRDTTPSHPHWDKGKMSRNWFVPHDSQKELEMPPSLQEAEEPD